jgi:AbrB family looped-hinge helix DNA binding protein
MKSMKSMKLPKVFNNTPSFTRPVKGMMDKFVMGSATVGAKGQIVLPVNVRKAFNIVPGETLIVMSGPGRGGHGIMLLKTSSLAHMLEHIEETGKTIRSLVKAQGAGRGAHGKAGRGPGGKGAKRRR